MHKHSKHFLGKKIPGQSEPRSALRKPRSIAGSWSLFFLLPVVLGALFITQPQLTDRSSTSSRSAELRDSATAFSRTLGAQESQVVACGRGDAFIKQVRQEPLFPFIPDSINSKADGGCKPAVWSRDVIVALLLRALALLNWLAVGLAIIMTVVGGIYYIAGFANENMVKTGKKYLVAVYLGVAIISLAQIMVTATFNVFNPTDPRDGIDGINTSN